jgi:hypothetical protein
VSLCDKIFKNTQQNEMIEEERMRRRSRRSGMNKLGILSLFL